ncbi:MAG: hypothetical protein ACLFSN_00235 [Candidatus Woesearchaeota archaeon]
MFSGKKGEFLTKVIVVLVSLIILMMLANQLHGSVKDSTEGLSCKAMLVNQHATQSSIVLPNFKNACETVDKKISLKDKSKEDVMKELANILAEAWWTTNEGKTKGMWSDKQYLLAKQGYDCLVRYHVFFEDVEKRDFDEEKITPEELKLYLEDTYKNDEYTYHQYFQVGGGSGAYEIANDIYFASNGPEYVVSLASPKLSYVADKAGDHSTTLILSKLKEGINMGCELI